MKLSIRTLALGLLPGLVIVASCHKSNNPSPSYPSGGGGSTTQSPLQAYISSDTSLSIYEAAIAKALQEGKYGIHKIAAKNSKREKNMQTGILPQLPKNRTVSSVRAAVESRGRSEKDLQVGIKSHCRKTRGQTRLSQGDAFAPRGQFRLSPCFSAATDDQR